jgi:hypothetical protein
LPASLTAASCPPRRIHCLFLFLYFHIFILLLSVSSGWIKGPVPPRAIVEDNFVERRELKFWPQTANSVGKLGSPAANSIFRQDRQAVDMDSIQEIFKQIENILRGKHSDAQIRKLADDAFELLVAVNHKSYAEETATIHDAEETAAIGLKLYNKCKNLPASDNFGEIKAFLKAASAWLMFQHSKPSPAGIVAMIKLLCR